MRSAARVLSRDAPAGKVQSRRSTRRRAGLIGQTSPTHGLSAFGGPRGDEARTGAGELMFRQLLVGGAVSLVNFPVHSVAVASVVLVFCLSNPGKWWGRSPP